MLGLISYSPPLTLPLFYSIHVTIYACIAKSGGPIELNHGAFLSREISIVKGWIKYYKASYNVTTVFLCTLRK